MFSRPQTTKLGRISFFRPLRARAFSKGRPLAFWDSLFFFLSKTGGEKPSTAVAAKRPRKEGGTLQKSKKLFFSPCHLC